MQLGPRKIAQSRSVNSGFQRSPSESTGSLPLIDPMPPLEAVATAVEYASQFQIVNHAISYADFRANVLNSLIDGGA
jgi:hypothetical protein